MSKPARDLQPNDRVETGDGFFKVVKVIDDEHGFEVVLDGNGGSILMGRDNVLEARDDGTFVIFPSDPDVPSYSL